MNGLTLNIVAGDGEEIDDYIIGEFELLERLEGYIVTIIKRKMNMEEK